MNFEFRSQKEKMDQEQLAGKIARYAHAGQYRRDGKTDYITHPERVVARVETCDAKAVAWLHDVLEDTSETEQSLLRQGISPKVVEAVKVLTKVDGISYAEYLTRVRQNSLAKEVKVQDMLDNLSDAPTEKQILKYAKGLLSLLD